MSHRFRLIFWGIVAAQLMLLLALIGLKEHSLSAGTSVVLQAVPVDPRSLFQGDYAVLRYEISALHAHLIGLSRGTRVYVALEERDGVWEPKWYSASRPSEGEVFIKGTVDGRGFADFGIGTYFVPEGTGHIIERAGDVKVRVSVDSGGSAIITEVLVDGESFRSRQTPELGSRPAKGGPRAQAAGAGALSPSARNGAPPRGLPDG